MKTFIGPSSWRRSGGYGRVASALVGAALVSAGLATGAAARPQTGSPATAPGAGAAGHASATRGGLRPINQRALQAIVRKTARQLHVPGALVLLRTPQGKFTAAYGTTRLGSHVRPQPYTHFRIASITKTMTSAAIQRLAQEGKLRLSDPVSKYTHTSDRPSRVPQSRRRSSRARRGACSNRANPDRPFGRQPAVAPRTADCCINPAVRESMDLDGDAASVAVLLREAKQHLRVVIVILSALS